MTDAIDPEDRRMGWRLVGLGALLFATGIIGVAVAWFPSPPHAAPVSGWQARWLAAGAGWFGLVFVCAGVVGLQVRDAGRPFRRVGRLSFVLALACWSAWLASLVSR